MTDYAKIGLMNLEQRVKILRDETGKEVVQMDIDVFKAIEGYIEDQGLLEAMLQNKGEKLSQEDAMDYYAKLKQGT